jgi:hypothetical protein
MGIKQMYRDGQHHWNNVQETLTERLHSGNFSDEVARKHFDKLQRLHNEIGGYLFGGQTTANEALQAVDKLAENLGLFVFDEVKFMQGELGRIKMNIEEIEAVVNGEK